MTRRGRRTTSDAVEILHRRYIAGRPDQEAALENARVNAAIAQSIYDLRTRAGLTQKQLASLVGTAHSVISRLEDADYRGHSIRMLLRISTALNQRVEIRIVPMMRRPRIDADHRSTA